MTDTIIPIPKDARVGDIVWFRDGQRKEITHFLKSGCLSVRGLCPGWVQRNGKSYAVNRPKWDCIGFQYADGRKPPLGVAKPAKQANAGTLSQKLVTRIRAWERERKDGTTQLTEAASIVEQIAKRLERKS